MPSCEGCAVQNAIKRANAAENTQRAEELKDMCLRCLDTKLHLNTKMDENRTTINKEITERYVNALTPP